jgi:hypothetical protein
LNPATNLIISFKNLERNMTLLQFDATAETGKPTNNNENFRIWDLHFNNVILAGTIKLISHKLAG